METLFENELALVLIVKNESRYIKEWLEYHYRIGVDKFYIYNNDSEDRSELLEILAPWIQAGVVEFEDAPGKFKQMPVYNDALQKHRFDCRYIGFIDTDEFIYLKTGQTLPEFLRDHFDKNEWVAGLGINWRTFGSSGKKSYEPLDVIDRFTFRARDDYDSNNHIKTILNPRRTLSFNNPHSATYFPTSACYNERGEFIPYCFNYKNTTDLIQINHYYTKSIAEYLAKDSRGRADFAAARSNDASNGLEVDNLEDVGLKNLWRQLKSQPLDLKSHRKEPIENVRKMLALHSELTIESLVTCFILTQKSNLLDAQQKILIREFLLESLLNLVVERTIQPWDLTLILSEYPEILKSRSVFGIELLQKCSRVIPGLITVCETETRYECRFFLRQIQRVFEIFLR